MRLPSKAPHAFEWNLNTILNAITLAAVIFGGAGVLVGGGAGYQRLVSQIDSNLERWTETEGDVTRNAALIDALEDSVADATAVTTRLSDRVSAAEARSTEFAQTVRELQATLNSQSGDLKVILAWIEEQRRRTSAQQ